VSVLLGDFGERAVLIPLSATDPIRKHAFHKIALKPLTLR